METHRIAVLSDTHGILRPEAAAVLKTCEAALHAGDAGSQEVIDQMNKICPAHVVRGNVDRQWAKKLPRELETELFGFRIYMVHNKKQIREDLAGIDIIIYGHSHKYEVSHTADAVYLNPGSCGPRRFRQPVTMMVLTLFPKEHRFETERIDLLQSEPVQKELSELSDRDMYELIRRIIRDVDAGRGTAEIAARSHVDEEFAQQVCRMYLTHPGVDVDGIMDRLERKNL
ncbi:MAG: metallophosphoesterase family protein [Lachnospiraceae bacterium]|nr:metallophosphoesterase family protein [Lachnospiraceae bacterium]